MKKTLLCFLFFISITQKSFAGELDGYEKIAEWTVSGYVDIDEKQGFMQPFNGCAYGRKIIFTNNKYLVCKSFYFHFAYRPIANIFSNGYDLKMVVDDIVFDVKK